MAGQVYTYVDGESHYVRLERAWRALHGEEACLTQLRFGDDPNAELILHISEANVFWTRRWSPGQRTMYVTAMHGHGGTIHEARRRIRDFDLEPHVFEERKALAQRRKTILEQAAVIEKPKAVDCTIFVKMLTDAHSGLYDAVNLYTSDVDYVPLIEAVANMGKIVRVHGFRDALGENSALEHVAKFIDLGKMLRDDCHCVPK